jgi:hypothetical protein
MPIIRSLRLYRWPQRVAPHLGYGRLLVWCMAVGLSVRVERCCRTTSCATSVYPLPERKLLYGIRRKSGDIGISLSSIMSLECISSNQRTRAHRVPTASGVPRIFFFWGGGCSTNSIEDRGQRERGSGGDSPLVRGSGGSCNLVQET